MATKKQYILRGQKDIVSVSKKTYKLFYKMRRREKYLEEADAAHDLVSYNALDADEYSGEEIIADHNEDSVADIVVQKLMVEKLLLCIPKLPDKDRTLITLKYWDAKSEKEIAEIMGISQQTVSWRLGKTLKLLKRYLES